MCRGAGEGGRRCPGHHDPKALEAHNRRRRENRAIKAGVVSWAKKQPDVDTDEVRGLQAAGPKAVKDWAEAKGLDPRKFLDSDPTNIVAGRGADTPDAAPVPVVAPAMPAVGGGGVPGRPAGANGVSGGMSPRPVAAPAPLPAGAPAWTRESWATSELTSQIDAVIASQGTHRDEKSLLSGVATRSTSASGGTNDTYRVELDNGMAGYHKPFSGLADHIARSFGQNAAEQPVHEFAAWQLAKRMGRPYEDIVPPCVLREVNGQLGSFLMERPGRNMAAGDVKALPEWKDAAFFDALIGQQDRHPGNFLVSGDRVTLIDHGYSFAKPGNHLNFSWFQMMRANEPLTRSEVAVLDELIADPELFGLSKVLSPDRADAVLKRAMRMKREGKIPRCGSY